MRRLRHLSLLALAACVLGSSTPAAACLHAGPGFQITQRSHEAFAVVHDGVEDLVLKIAYRSDQPPAALGMVIPVPNVPTRYAALEPGFFASVRRWVDLDTGTHMRGLRGRDERTLPAVVELPPVQAGPYDIHPIQASGPDAVGAVRAWLEEHGFSTIPEAALAPYAEAGWTYLAVRVAPTDAEHLASTAELPPLHIRFATPAAVFPVRLEAQGTFPMWLYLATPNELPDDAFDGAIARGFQVARAGSRAELPPTDPFPMSRRHAFDPALTPAPLHDFLESIGDWSEQGLYLRVLHANRFGAGRAAPRTWDGELTIPPMADADLVVESAPDPEPEVAPEPEVTAEPEVAAEPAPDRAVEEASPPGSAPTGCGCRAAPGSVSFALLLVPVVALALRRPRGRRRR